MTIMQKLSPVRSPWRTLRFRQFFSMRLDRRVPLIASILLLVTFGVLVISISYGAYKMTPWDVVLTLFNANRDHADYANFVLVVHTFRLPRILLAFLVGMALATSGAILQGLTRNPLAEPSLLGINAGAAVVAVAMIVWLKDVPLAWLPFGAFGGALLTATVIYFLAWKGGHSSTLRLVLVGVGVAVGLDGIITIFTVFGDTYDVQQAFLWLTGSVYGRTWEHVKVLSAWLVWLLPLAFLQARSLNTLHLGDDVASGLGVAVERQRAILLVISVALAAVAVSVAGTLGFVGLVAPHIVRRLVGPAHEGLLPISALFGGGLLVLADLVGRWVIAPSELPLGVMTALIGAPYFMFLLYRNRNQAI